MIKMKLYKKWITIGLFMTTMGSLTGCNTKQTTNENVYLPVPMSSYTHNSTSNYVKVFSANAVNKSGHFKFNVTIAPQRTSYLTTIYTNGHVSLTGIFSSYSGGAQSFAIVFSKIDSYGIVTKVYSWENPMGNYHSNINYMIPGGKGIYKVSLANYASYGYSVKARGDIHWN